MTDFASSLWDSAAGAVESMGAAAAAAGAAAYVYAGKFHGLRMPTSRLGLFMLGGLVAISILVLILSNTSGGASGQRYYSTGQLYVHFEVENEIVRFPLPENIAQDGGFGDKVIPGMSKKNPIALPSPVVRKDVENLAKATIHTNKRNYDSVTLDQWNSILKLTGIDAPFDFENLVENLRGHAVHGVGMLFTSGNISTAQLLAFGLKHNIADWIACPSETLARRDEPLTVEEIMTVGPSATHTLTKIYHDSTQWLDVQVIKPTNGRQDYPFFWERVKAGFADELAEDNDWLPLLESPCERPIPVFQRGDSEL